MKTFFLITITVLLIGCAGSIQGVTPACRMMEAQLKEKKDLDAKVKETSKQVKSFRQQGDTASAASAEHRLEGMLENQRLMKESLEQSSRDCSPTAKDPMPIRDPASRDPAPK